MPLLDRYTRHALWMAGVEVVAYLGLVGYGLWSPSLGQRLVAPALVMALAWAALAWLTLKQPWDLEWSRGGVRGRFRATYGWAPFTFFLAITSLAAVHGHWLFHVRRTAATVRARLLDPWSYASPPRGWRPSDDAWGLALVTGPVDWVWTIALPVLLLGLTWWRLPSRSGA